jgi:tetratricopeptide (TPR) repeat protein
MERQLAADPTNALYRRNLSVTENHVANAMRKAGDPQGALAHVQKSLVLAEQVSASDPKDSGSASDVANSHFKMGEVLADLGRGPGALQQDIQAIDILNRMLAGSTDSNLLRLLIRAHLAAADAEVKMNHWAGGMEHYGEAARSAQGIVHNDPRQAYARSELARALTGIAEGQTHVGSWREARDSYRGALENWSELRRQNALGPDELGLPEQAALKVAWCERRLKP